MKMLNFYCKKFREKTSAITYYLLFMRFSSYFRKCESEIAISAKYLL